MLNAFLSVLYRSNRLRLIDVRTHTVNESAIKTARLRVELEQSRREQKDYLRQVELARVLDKRVKRKREVLEKKGEKVDEALLLPPLKRVRDKSGGDERKTREWTNNKDRKEKGSGREPDPGQLKKVLGSIF